MTDGGPRDPKAKALDFEHEFMVRGATDTRAFSWGFAIASPSGWKLVVVQPAPAADVVMAADAVGTSTAVVAVDCLGPGSSSEIEAALVAAGFEDSVELLMGHQGDVSISSAPL